ncbi:ubiquitin carboxyl-terminal hydrolase 24-like isoform X2 [Liolophura sinensis]|uniref:ubiquitin carboxyl-terminal hydrolase 24-like isoform X2 n=1 Tax=Liolophura sinensis TaxID=3198878 RepID=UPI0031597CDD
MEIDEDHVKTLLAMGFPSVEDVRKALRLGKNDLNEAVAILTNEHPSSSYDTVDELDVEMKDVHYQPSSVTIQLPVYGPSLPPSYDEAVETEVVEESSEKTDAMTTSGGADDSNSLEFPVTNLYELEGRVFTEHWSIPYKREESLGKCLLSATRLADAGLADSDENCKRFMERCMPEAFQKLLASSAVHKWGTEIQEGIYNMLQLLVDLVVARLQHSPAPVDLLDVLALALTPDTEFHYKNKMRRPDRVAKDDGDGDKLQSNNYAASPPSGTYKDPYGWLSNLINRFGQKGGFTLVQKFLETENLDAPAMAALLRPFGVSAEYLNFSVVEKLLTPGMERAIKYVQSLEEKDFKEKKVGSVSDLLASMKLLCLNMLPNDVDSIDELRLNIALRMLKSPHFNAKMNSLKEVTKLIEDSTGSKVPKTAIGMEKILEWLVDNRLLSIALEGNIDQAQYCDKIKGIVDFLGAKLSLDELTMIWKMQNGQTNNVIDNIHSIVAAAAVKFDAQQLEHLFLLIQKNWQEDNDRMREKLLALIGKIGRDARVSKTTTRVLELLWDLSHLPVLSTHLMEQALDEHLAILSDSYIVKEQVKRQYVVKCVEDIKKGVWVLPAIKQMLHISKNILKQTFPKTDKGILHELNKNFDLIKLITNSLVKCHKTATTAQPGKLISPETIVDSRYTHADYVSTHLTFLQYVLQEGVLYLPSNRARDIWGVLVANQDACDWDRETCYEWFSKGLADLEPETQSQLFQKELLKQDPAKLSQQGFTCFKSFFESVNLYDHKLKKSANVLVVEKAELCGLEYLWEVCLNTSDETIAELAITLLLNMSYSGLAPRLKKDPPVLHKKFINECYNRLESALFSLGGSTFAKIITLATKTLTAATVPEVACVPSPSRSAKLLNIERLLWIAEGYVLSVEGTHITPRTILPHGASFHGHPTSFLISCESTKQEYTLQCHSNETLGSLRQKVAKKLKQSPDNIQVVAGEKMLPAGKDQKLLHQLELEDNQMILVRIFSPSTTSTVQNSQNKEPPSTPTAKQSFDLEQEKMLPGVVMAAGGQVFEMLYQLADLEEPRIRRRVRKLLMLIPTDPAITDALDSISQRTLKQSPSTDDVSPRSSPKKTTLSPTPSPAPSSKCPKDTLKSLFDANAPDMSTFRVLYNLEVLSNKLMPTSYDLGVQHSAQSFCEDFLNAGGLSLVVSVLQKDSIPMEVDYQTRQGCYSICLQLARFLLCGETVTGEDQSNYATNEQRCEETGIVSTMTRRASAASGHLPLIDVSLSAGSRAIQTMGVHDFTETVSCFMRVTWAAAAGRLHLVGCNQPIRESSGWYTGGRRSRQSSTGSTGSTSSEGEGQTLHSGVCVQQQTISTTDTNIAREALELLVACLRLRSQLISSFYSLPCVADFIIDILVGCVQDSIRTAALEQFMLLSQTDNSGTDNHVQTPQQFLLQVILKAYLPFWVTSSTTRGASQRLLRHCSQYFELRCRLLDRLSIMDQEKLQIDCNSMLEDELAWLGNFVPSENCEVKETDNILLAGHLKLLRTLFTCDNVSKEEHGKSLVGDLLHDFLFPASKLITSSNVDKSTSDTSLTDVNPKCSNGVSRTAAYELLTELASGSQENLTFICQELISMHHLFNPDSANEWEYMPPVDGRADCGFVGLKNAGATCYMNSVIQQLFMTPGIPDTVLGVDEENPDEDSVFYQIQQMYGHLLESKLQYHVPERFWKVFKLWGQTINVREQQDAFDFFQALIDQVDEHLKKLGKEKVFMKKFQGIFSDQKICKDCPHRYEREEAFFALNLTVKNATLQDSLDQFVKGELLEGDNAYFCEKCGEKRNTIKRMCIKTLPPVLCIQLKRFGYDWESNRALKFDDYFKFPWTLDMEPYTTEGMALRENSSPCGSSSGYDTDNTDRTDGELQTAEITSEDPKPYQPINYELVGIVVHNGQANAGHYYSFIKDRRGTVLTNNQRGKWFKFNDNIVEEFEMSETTLEAECFGGTYKAKIYDQSSSYPEDRLRYWNGYMLFYEKLEEPQTPVSAKKSKITAPRRAFPTGGSKAQMDSDSLVELTELVHKGEKRGIFTEKMPAHIQQVIRSENLTFIRNRDVYSQDYFNFVRNLVDKNSFHTSHPQYSSMCVQSVQLGIRFLFNTYLRTKKKLRCDMNEWVAIIESLVSRSKEACMWLVEYLANEEGSTYIRPFLLECPQKDVRVTFAKLLERLMCSFFQHGGVTTHKSYDEILEVMLQMLNKDVPENVKNCVQYFLVLKCYVQMGTKACAHMFGRSGFKRLMTFLLGNMMVSSEQQIEQSVTESLPRRWTSLQSRDFGHLHTCLATLILNCEVASYRTVEPGKFPVRRPLLVTPHIYLKMSQDMVDYVFGKDSHRYIKEVITAVREISGNTLSIFDMLVYCSFCNETFSCSVLKQVALQYTHSPSNELKTIFNLLMELLTLEDELQLKRIQWIIDGHVDSASSTSYEGLLTVIRTNHVTDSRRSYQCIKFLVSLANKCALAKDYLMQTPNKWQWAVNWLKKKMTEYYWNPPTAVTSNEDSNRKSFQRTVSAQDTLAEATALLTELEAHDMASAEMDTAEGDNIEAGDDEGLTMGKIHSSGGNSSDNGGRETSPR